MKTPEENKVSENMPYRQEVTVVTSYGTGLHTGEYDKKTDKMNGFGIFIDLKGVIYEGFFK